jgi:hypothetical protein
MVLGPYPNREKLGEILEMTMKICPFCAEEIQEKAIKCKHCGEFLKGAPVSPEQSKIPWYYRKSYIVIALLCVGPLALPLIWLRPQTSPAWKIGLTLGVLVLSWFLFQATMESIHTFEAYFKLLNEL